MAGRGPGLPRGLGHEPRSCFSARRGRGGPWRLGQVPGGISACSLPLCYCAVTIFKTVGVAGCVRSEGNESVPPRLCVTEIHGGWSRFQRRLAAVPPKHYAVSLESLHRNLKPRILQISEIRRTPGLRWIVWPCLRSAQVNPPASVLSHLAQGSSPSVSPRCRRKVWNGGSTSLLTSLSRKGPMWRWRVRASRQATAAQPCAKTGAAALWIVPSVTLTASRTLREHFFDVFIAGEEG